jgi:hypothetical protein
MTQIEPQLATYEILRQQQFEQIDGALQSLHDQIASQLEHLRQQEQTLLDTQISTLALLRPTIGADARCLLPTPQFGQFITMLIASRDRSLPSLDRTLRVTENPMGWLLATVPVPLEVLNYEQIQDDWAYNDENHYTDYRYELTARLGLWQKTVDASTASLHPGNPIRYYLKDLRSQHYDVSYRLLDADRYLQEPVPQPEFPELHLDEAGVVQLKQEISCVLAFVGNLFNIHSRVEHFRYPSHRRND